LKPKIYLDTSVISHLDQPEKAEEMRDTLELWEILKSGAYEVFISTTVLDELLENEPPKRERLFRYLAEIEYTVIETTEEIKSVADQIIALGILTDKNRDDCLHIGAAVTNRCDIIVSWNFKHIVKLKTIKGVRAITSLLGYPNVDIVQPTLLLDREE